VVRPGWNRCGRERDGAEIEGSGDWLVEVLGRRKRNVEGIAQLRIGDVIELTYASGMREDASACFEVL
jgi:hypothetical protein